MIIKFWICTTPLVAQWVRICLLMQGTQVWCLVWEDSTCRRATVCVPQLLSPCSGTQELSSRAHTLQQEKLPQWKAHTLKLESSPCSQLEKAHMHWQTPKATTAKKNWISYFYLEVSRLIILLLSRHRGSRLFHVLIQQILLITYDESVMFWALRCSTGKNKPL